MSTNRTPRFLAIGLAALAATAATPAWSGAPALVSYQGRLVLAEVGPVTDPTLMRFRLYLGGDDVSPVSSGLRVYDETALVQPGPSGIFSHAIGSGTPAAACADGPCALTPEDFGDGATAVWIEVRVDPDGVAGNADDDVLLPRTRVGSVGFAFRVASLDGAAGGSLAGEVAADHLRGRTGATLGDGGADVALTFDGSTQDPSLTWDDPASELVFSARTRHAQGLALAPGQAVTFGPSGALFPALAEDAFLGRLVLGGGYQTTQLGSGAGDAHLAFEATATPARLSWLAASREFFFSDEVRFDTGITLRDLTTISYGPFTNPVPGTYVRYYKTHDTFADGNLDGVPDQDHVVGICYNCAEPSGAPEVPTEYAMRAQWEMTYAPIPGQRVVEHNWNFVTSAYPRYRPLAFFLDVDADNGFAEPWAKWTFMTDRNKVALHINQNGNVAVGSNSPQPTRQLEVRGDAWVQGNLQLGACADTAASNSVTVDGCGTVRLTGSGHVRRIYGCGASDAGRLLYVVCGNDPSTLCDGNGSNCGSGNLRLAGTDADFVCTPDDVLTLLCDGANWRQVGVSAN